MRQVLVAEDDRDTREVLVLILRDAGYAVSAAADVFTALAKTRTPKRSSSVTSVVRHRRDVYRDL